MTATVPAFYMLDFGADLQVRLHLSGRLHSLWSFYMPSPPPSPYPSSICEFARAYSRDIIVGGELMLLFDQMLVVKFQSIHTIGRAGASWALRQANLRQTMQSILSRRPLLRCDHIHSSVGTR